MPGDHRVPFSLAGCNVRKGLPEQVQVVLGDHCLLGMALSPGKIVNKINQIISAFMRFPF
jgi:hypothetical protein